MMSNSLSRRRARGAAVAVPLALALAATGAALPASAVDEPAPLLHYTMDDVSGGTVPDATGNDLDGTLTGTAETIPTDDGGSALDLPGGADGGYVTIPRAALEGATDLTVSAQVRWDGGAAWQRIFDLGTDSSRYLFTTPSNGDGDLRTALTSSGGSGEAAVTGYGALRSGEWATVTTTLDAEAGTVTTYLNGVAVRSATTAMTAADLLTADAESAGYIGKSFYPDPLLDGAVDDFRIYDAALGAQDVAALVGDTPVFEALTNDSFDIRTVVADPPELPASVRAQFADGYDRDVPATWEDADPAQYAETGTFTVRGEAAGTPISATVTVHRGGLQVDFGTDTGEFHGGASGTLYGVYGDGLPSDNLLEGMGVRTVSTKAQDGPQHPGADALEVVRPLADATDGDVYIYMTDVHRGFPYQWEGDTPEEKLSTYLDKIAAQVDQVLELPEDYRDNIVFVPFNEPEGNMFGTGEWSYNGTSWLDDPADYFAAWDAAFGIIRDRMPSARISGPNTSVLYDQITGYLDHVVEAGTVPDVMTWHELSHPEQIRSSVDTYRQWEADAFAGTELEGSELPININEYAFNYHTSVPGQMIQWISAIEEKKVDADIAYWNIDGNLSDSAVQSNRGNGQWWLYNAYSQMTGHTVEVAPPFPGENYTLQGVAALDEDRAIARTIIGGADGAAPIDLQNMPTDVFGDEVRVTVREIPWTGQLGDSAQPRLLSESTAAVSDGTVQVDFDGEALPLLTESSAYEIVVTPAGYGESTAQSPTVWNASYEAEDAEYSGSGHSVNGPEGSPDDVGKFYTSGGYNVGGLRTGSDGVLDFEVTVPEDGAYDLSVFANSANTFDAVAEQGPTNVFLRVDGAAEQELFLPLAYKWVVWDHADATVELTAGTHTISLAAQSLDGEGATLGDAIIDRMTLALPNPNADVSVYEAELATLNGGQALYAAPDGVDPASVSGAGGVALDAGDSATFWVYGENDAEAEIGLDLIGDGEAALSVNGHDVLTGSGDVAAHLAGGVNKVVVTAGAGGAVVDRITVGAGAGALKPTVLQAEDAALAGGASATELSLADGGLAVDGVGGEPGNDSSLTFRVDAEQAGPHAVVMRYSNPEQSPASHYNPDPIARHADVSVNGGEAERILFPHTFHENSFWEKTIVLDLAEGENTIALTSEEATNFDGETYASDDWPDFPLRSQWAPIVDRIAVSPLSSAVGAAPVSVEVGSRCVGGKVQLTVRTTNISDEPVSVDISTAYGDRTIGRLGAERSATRAFAVRSETADAGEVIVTAAGVETTQPYENISCG